MSAGLIESKNFAVEVSVNDSEINGDQQSLADSQLYFQADQGPPGSGHPTYRGTTCRAPDRRDSG